MHSLTVLGPAVQLAAFASFSHSVSATNLVKFINHCQYDLFYWPVGSPAAHGPPPEDADYIRVPAQSQGTHQMLDTSTGGGISLKIRDLPYYSAAHGILQAEYNVVPDGRVYYDLSLVNCNKLDDPTDHTFCPFASGGVWMYSDVAESQEHGLDCLPAHCTLFTDRCMATYWSHGAWSGEPTLQCPAGRDYYVETCTDNPGKRSDDGQPFESTSAPWVKPPWNPLWGPEGFFTYRPDYIYSPPGWPARENVPPPGVPAGPISAPAPGSAPAPSPAPAPPAPKPDDSWPLPPCDKPGTSFFLPDS
ncbi:hypothetical protein K491DRAFT_683136 [Lophiostoma macrostomum CBS 122681]|uniref:Osmotin, thaumatin-like protein n=1 Tax=Lophiostoma macrostomum CBS 122681 TaxID=1314788 RepID=A0A6A6SV03_9PLEO|nr:hypothetical protein K491DRAFT_683136 [Lophiostoma macrostomum CBS 122681]